MPVSKDLLKLVFVLSVAGGEVTCLCLMPGEWNPLCFHCFCSSYWALGTQETIQKNLHKEFEHHPVCCWSQIKMVLNSFFGMCFLFALPFLLVRGCSLPFHLYICAWVQVGVKVCFFYLISRMVMLLFLISWGDLDFWLVAFCVLQPRFTTAAEFCLPEECDCRQWSLFWSLG